MDRAALVLPACTFFNIGCVEVDVFQLQLHCPGYMIQSPAMMAFTFFLSYFLYLQNFTAFCTCRISKPDFHSLSSPRRSTSGERFLVFSSSFTVFIRLLHNIFLWRLDSHSAPPNNCSSVEESSSKSKSSCHGDSQEVRA